VDEVRDLYLAKLFEPATLTSDPLSRLDRAEYGVHEFLPAFLEAVRMAADAEPSRPLLGFKTTETAYVHAYARAFPGMRFAHIVRHPLANYSSLKRTVMDAKRRPFWNVGEDILWTFLEARWLPHARAIATLVQSHPDRHYLLRYEDLVGDPQAEIAKLCAWLGIRLPAESDTQTVLGGRRMSALPPNPSKPGQPTPERVVASTAESFGYEDNVTEREAALIAHLTAPLASSFGYDDLTPARSREALWRSWLLPDEGERENVESWPRWAVEILRRRMYVTRKLVRRAA
jgi:hypothetical protein